MSTMSSPPLSSELPEPIAIVGMGEIINHLIHVCPLLTHFNQVADGQAVSAMHLDYGSCSETSDPATKNSMSLAFQPRAFTTPIRIVQGP